MTTKAPRQKNAKLFDKAIIALQDVLEENLIWLDFAYGRVQHIKQNIKNKTYSKPVIYTSLKDYIDVLPDDNRGNTAFFILQDPQNILNFTPNTKNVLQSNFSLIFWYDVSKINGNDTRNTEAIKAEILNLLTNCRLCYGTLELTSIKEDIDSIFKEYYISDKATKYTKHPYHAIRFEGKLTIKDLC